MAARIKASLPQAEVDFATGVSGEFLVEVDDTVLWDKKQMSNLFPDEESLVGYLVGQNPG